VLPEGTAAHLKKGSWPQTELFAWLQKTAGIDDIEMNRTFNNGIGMVVVDAANAEATAATLRAAGRAVYTIGRSRSAAKVPQWSSPNPARSSTTRMAQHQPQPSPEPAGGAHHLHRRPTALRPRSVWCWPAIC
jgi:hypothetical protein